MDFFLRLSFIGVASLLRPAKPVGNRSSVPYEHGGTDDRWRSVCGGEETLRDQNSKVKFLNY